MMKKFNVTVNGSTYSVEVEEVGGAVSVAPAVAAAPVVAAPVAAAPVAAPAAAPVAAPAAAPVAAGTTTVDAPMPGKVLSVNVKKGDKVASGDVLLILEAMKMQNEIMAPSDGVVSDIRVNAGDTVATGDVMIVM